MKYDIFKTEISYIKDKNNQNNIKELLNGVPDYFYKIPASTTGKYHPTFSLGSQGLVRHTKVAVKIANDLLENNSVGYSFTSHEKDLILMALLLHDSFKCGIKEEQYTRFDHPIIASQYVEKSNLLNENDKKLLSSMIASHMGEWNTNKYSNVTLPKPSNKYQRFVHMCDYLASRIYLDVRFDNNEIVEMR